ncbi:MAG: TetR/AcrR family transcriptional regulator [Candidatus Abyssobacteria bacterium SURF_17]|uniref:TetR/AcrR family transcriptional regulator n=1 Tax=Candidatus Abyssobacteria bacterium SURF_17 TaxID=2093361 RepID=A0A419EYK3_9BACT|nr:MAG: TetR/AcrR family transcriptional regulator [Candidatus Abyssubacteria bacterium SURF_17]
MASKTFQNIPKDKQDRVLRAAQIEFAKFGYHQANVSDICKRAGISNGALYKYFKNKSDLYQAVIQRQIEGKEEYMRGVVASTATCLEKLRMLMENTQTDVDARNDTFRILLQLSTADMNSFAKKVTRRIESSSFDHIRAILTDGIARGEVRGDMDVEMTAHFVNSFCFFLYAAFVSEYHRIRLEEVFHIPFVADEAIQSALVDRIMSWITGMLSPAARALHGRTGPEEK